MKRTPSPLLAADEAEPVSVRNAGGASPLLLVADHAGVASPRALGRLGVSAPEWQRHIAGLGDRLADALDATLIRQNYSRLVIDCNRPLEAPTSIPEISELTPIPGNVGLTADARAERARAIFVPYHQRIEAEIESRRAAGRLAALLALHSFTPSFKGQARPWHVALLHNRDRRLADRLIGLFKQEPGLVVGDNEPYFVSDATDYTIPVHGERHGLPHALIEIRQDLIAEEAGQQQWAERLARLVPQACGLPAKGS
jgi:predicted N-formylglutamate amidohydrolase